MLRLFARPDPDAELVAAARRGDARAFNLLVGRHQERLIQFARSRLDPRIDAEDVAQEVFVAAWRQLPEFHRRSQFRTWLFGIALNWCAGAARKHRRRPEFLEDRGGSETDALPAWGGPMGDAYEQITAREAMRERLAALPQPEREVLELYYYAELNLREISELLEVNHSTVKSRFYQAHGRMRAGFETEPMPTGAAAGRGR